MNCSISNFWNCIPQLMFDFIMNVINSPIIPLLDLIKKLLITPVEISLFASLWAIMLYVISLFYGLLMVYSGFNFIISGYDAEKRIKAKTWFRNIFIMIVLVQASYFLYGLTVDLGSLLTEGIFGLIDNSFFYITADNIVNIGLQFFFGLFYVLILLFTVLLLSLRYIIVASGVVLVPIGIFCYYIPPLQSYGRLILNFLGICIFVAFFDAIIFLVCSRLLDISLFQNFKILVMICAFLLSDLLMFYLMFFSAIKSALKVGGQTAGVITSTAKYFA